MQFLRNDNGQKAPIQLLCTTPYIAVHFALQYTKHCNTLHTAVHYTLDCNKHFWEYTLQYTIHCNTLNTDVHYILQHTIRRSTINTAVDYTRSKLYTALCFRSFVALHSFRLKLCGVKYIVHCSTPVHSSTIQFLTVYCSNLHPDCINYTVLAPLRQCKLHLPLHFPTPALRL